MYSNIKCCRIRFIRLDLYRFISILYNFLHDSMPTKLLACQKVGMLYHCVVQATDDVPPTALPCPHVGAATNTSLASTGSCMNECVRLSWSGTTGRGCATGPLTPPAMPRLLSSHFYRDPQSLIQVHSRKPKQFVHASVLIELINETIKSCNLYDPNSVKKSSDI